MNPRTRTTLAAAGATLLTALGMLRLVNGGSWVAQTLLAIIIVAVLGDLLRRLALAKPLVLLIQLVALLLFDTAALAHAEALAGFVPTPQALSHIVDTLRTSKTDIKHLSPPAVATPGISAVLVSSLGLAALLVDAMAVTYAVAPMAGLPLLALYLVPATRLQGGFNWLFFVLAALGFLMLLTVEGKERLGHWGRPLVRPGRDGQRTVRVDTESAGTAGRQIGITAVVAALLVPIIIPTLPRHDFGLPSLGGGGNGAGGGGGADSQVIISQNVDIQGELRTSKPVTVFTYTTTANPGNLPYLWLESLDQFDGEKWSPISKVVHPLSPDKPLPSPFGMGAGVTTGPSITTDVTIGGPGNQPSMTFPALPVPYPPASLLAGGDWQYNSDLSVLPALNEGINPGLKYTVQSLNLTPTGAELNASKPVTGQLVNSVLPDLQLPANLPPVVRQDAQDVVRNAKATTPYAEAVALQNWFRDSGGFRYDVTQPDRGITDFLQRRVGYCQQFAGTMAAMARILGIPARVAVGFTPGDPKGGVYNVTTHDLHSWPELYFTGIGWLRFEPTPTAGTSEGAPPSYAANGVPAPAPSRQNTAPVPTTGPTTQAKGCKLARHAGQEALCNAQQGGGTINPNAAGTGSHGGHSVLGTIERLLFKGSTTTLALRWTVIVLAVLLLIPALLRRRIRRRRRRRYAGALPVPPNGRQPPDGAAAPLDAISEPIDVTSRRLQVLAAWEELRDSATDLGYPWSRAATPRQQRDQLVAAGQLDEPARQAMGRVTVLAEHARYAPYLDEDTSDVFTDVRTVRSGLAARVNRWTRMRATLLPASTLHRIKENRDAAAAQMYRTTSKLRPRREAKRYPTAERRVHVDQQATDE